MKAMNVSSRTHAVELSRPNISAPAHWHIGCNDLPEHRGKRLLMNVTTGHRALALRQSVVTTLLGALTMLPLCASKRTTPTVEHDALILWALATCANVVLRARSA
jgi:hypothetical protein